MLATSTSLSCMQLRCSESPCAPQPRSHACHAASPSAACKQSALLGFRNIRTRASAPAPQGRDLRHTPAQTASWSAGRAGMGQGTVVPDDVHALMPRAPVGTTPMSTPVHCMHAYVYDHIMLHLPWSTMANDASQPQRLLTAGEHICISNHV